MTQQFQPARVFLPGRVISEELEAHGWTQKDLAEIMGRPTQTINEIIKGTKQITPDTALGLADVFGTSAEFWMNLETNYQLFLARQVQRNDPVALKGKIYQMAPIAEMTRLGWIRKTSVVDELEQQVCQFFGVDKIGEQPQIAMNLRCSQHRKPKVNSQLAWAKRVENLARQQSVAMYDRQKFVQAIPELVKMSVQAGNVVQVPDFLRDLGMRFVIVPHLDKTYLDGAALHLDDNLDRPVVALTLRYNRIDNFWFTLMHEIAHIILGHEGVILDDLDDVDVDEKEATANETAHNWLLAPSDYDRFIQETVPTFSDAKIRSFAMQAVVHPGIIVGRLRREEKIPYSKFGKYVVPIKNDLQDWIDVVRPAALLTQGKGNYERLEEIGLVGCCDVEEDLSVNYKSVLAESIESKYDHR